jgi:hypothetical protein
MARPPYPFEPRSNAHLRPGQFWGIPLSNGRWACGRVLAVRKESDAYFRGNTRMFLAGLMDWESERPPTAEAIAGHGLLEQGWAHVLTIQRTGGQVLGERPLALDGIRGLRKVTHRAGGTVMLYEGAAPLRPASREEAATLPVLETWGYGFIAKLAEHRFVEQRRNITGPH